MFSPAIPEFPESRWLSGFNPCRRTGLADQMDIHSTAKTTDPEIWSQKPRHASGSCDLIDSLRTESIELQLSTANSRTTMSVLAPLIPPAVRRSNPSEIGYRPNVSKWAALRTSQKVLSNEDRSYVETTDTGWFPQRVPIARII